jgi:hypothetical protein
VCDNTLAQLSIFRQNEAPQLKTCPISSFQIRTEDPDDPEEGGSQQHYRAKSARLDGDLYATTELARQNQRLVAQQAKLKDKVNARRVSNSGSIVS